MLELVFLEVYLLCYFQGKIITVQQSLCPVLVKYLTEEIKENNCFHEKIRV